MYTFLHNGINVLQNSTPHYFVITIPHHGIVQSSRQELKQIFLAS